ncbi:von Willebrand factor A domain-containing protein 5A [Tritrichomonas musculus]|uniref:von Willebrand factor A domain-containing protein 5A n=1 Tax=Tritrichomonas musculus TaxID=1915356 RepID=A0ABR2HGL6_9EUKA
MNFISNIKANLGGTEMLLMLDDLFQDEIKIGSQRQIFIITDGEVYERSKVIQKVDDNCSMNRIFAIGLGHGADAGFLDEIAEMTNGKSDFVFNCEELPSKIEEQLELSLSNAATDVEINIEGNDSFQVAPYPLPPLLPHVVTHIFISSSLPIGDAMLSFTPNKTEVDNVISTKCEWSDKKEQKSPIFALFAQKQLKKISQDQQKSIELSLSSGVLCKYTSYIAVSENCYNSRKDTARFYDSPCDLMDDGFSSDPHDELSDPIDPFAPQYWKDCHPPFSCSHCDSFSSAAPPPSSFNPFGSPSATAIPEPPIENKLYYENKSHPGDDLLVLSPDSKESTSHASRDPFSSAAPPPSSFNPFGSPSATAIPEPPIENKLYYENKSHPGDDLLVLSPDSKESTSHASRDPFSSAAPPPSSFNPFSSPSATAIPEPPIENKLYYENKSHPGDDLLVLSPDSKESTSHASRDPFSSAAPPAPSFNPFSSSSSSMLNAMSQFQSSCSFSSGFTNTTTLKTSPASYSHAGHSDFCGLPSSHEDPFSTKDHLESSPKEKGDAMMNDFGSSQTQDLNDDIDDHSNVWDKNASTSDVIRLQSRDGFWDLPTSFVSKSFGGSLPNIEVDLSHSPIIKKRVMSSIFALGFLEKFQKTNLNKWKHAKEKCFKWLKRINSSVDWDKIIQSCLTKIF